VQRLNLEDSSAARRAPAKIPEGITSAFFLRFFVEKSGENGEKSVSLSSSWGPSIRVQKCQ
jgi:hypothetical protein